MRHLIAATLLIASMGGAFAQSPQPAAEAPPSSAEWGGALRAVTDQMADQAQRGARAEALLAVRLGQVTAQRDGALARVRELEGEVKGLKDKAGQDAPTPPPAAPAQ